MEFDYCIAPLFFKSFYLMVCIGMINALDSGPSLPCLVPEHASSLPYTTKCTRVDCPIPLIVSQSNLQQAQENLNRQTSYVDALKDVAELQLSRSSSGRSQGRREPKESSDIKENKNLVSGA